MSDSSFSYDLRRAVLARFAAGADVTVVEQDVKRLLAALDVVERWVSSKAMPPQGSGSA